MFLLLFVASVIGAIHAVSPALGSHCAPNQVVNRLTVYEDGSLEAECGPMPCGISGTECEEEPSCRAESRVAHGIRWAASGKSLLQRCCAYKLPNKIYVGTDIVTYGSYYQVRQTVPAGGQVGPEGLYGKEGAPEYDFIANMRAEQGGIRVWVYRIMCNPGDKPAAVPAEAITSPRTTTTTEEVAVEESNDDEGEEVEAEDEEPETAEQQDEAPEVEEKPFNPLRYRPPSVPSASTGVRRH